jgi:hypothetical protein
MPPIDDEPPVKGACDTNLNRVSCNGQAGNLSKLLRQSPVWQNE